MSGVKSSVAGVGILWAAAREQTNPKVASALDLRASRLIDDVLNERESDWY
jgi:hypothetical protein